MSWGFFKKNKEVKNNADFGSASNNVLKNNSSLMPTEDSECEIIAAICAAIAAMGEADNTVYKIKSVKAVAENTFSGRSAWAMAGLLDNTRPF